MTTFTLQAIAEHLKVPFQGDATCRLSSLANLAQAQAHQLSFLSNKQYAPHLVTTQAGAVIVKQGQEVPAHLNVIWVTDPYQAFAQISALFDQRVPVALGIHATAVIASSATIDGTARIGPHCTVGEGVTIGAGTELVAGVVIGDGSQLGQHCLIYPNTVIYHGVTLGDYVIVHAGTVIGSDGFGFARRPDGWTKIHQLGGVRVGNHVEIGAGCTIDRGALDDTIIEDGAILDNQVHLAHNCRVGPRTAIAGCTGIAGSTSIGADCTMGGMVAIAGHIDIADQVHINGSTVVTSSIEQPGHYGSGTVFQDVKTWRRNAVRFGQLNEWVERIKKLEKQLAPAMDKDASAPKS
jgi:UDP-3-O-[3-hydroxymyristoyl] glucosamine N-acyltransferase